MVRKYHNHTLQTKTRPDIIMHFIKQRNQFHFECKLYGQKCVSVSVGLPFVPNVVIQHVSGFVACCIEATHYKWKVPILLMVDVAYDAHFSVCNKRNTLRYSHRTKLFAVLQRRRLNQCISRFFGKIIVAKQ